MQRDKGGHLLIDLQQPHENMLVVVIQDDGIGRVAAALLKSKSATEKKSFGMQITSERLDLVNKIFNTETKVSVEDLYNEKKESLGTK